MFKVLIMERKWLLIVVLGLMVNSAKWCQAEKEVFTPLAPSKQPPWKPSEPDTLLDAKNKNNITLSPRELDDLKNEAKRDKKSSKASSSGNENELKCVC